METATIDRRTIEIAVEEEGKTRIREVFTVSSPLTGRMARINLHPGDPVVANSTVIAQIRATAPTLLDSRTRRVAEAAIDAAIANVDLANAQLSQAEAQGEFLKGELDRAERLARTGTTPERSLEKARLDLATGAAAIQSARANLVVRQRELERARAALLEPGETEDEVDCCVPVKSPVSGRVLRILTESEQVVQPGTPIVELGDPDDLEIVVDLLSRDAVRVKPGAKAAIEGWGGGPLQAEVERVDPAAFTKVSALGIEEQRVSVVLTPLGDPRGLAAAWPRISGDRPHRDFAGGRRGGGAARRAVQERRRLGRLHGDGGQGPNRETSDRRAQRRFCRGRFRPRDGTDRHPPSFGPDCRRDARYRADTANIRLRERAKSGLNCANSGMAPCQ